MTEDHDKHIERLYRQSNAASETPPDSLDVSILAAAHKAVSSKPRRLTGPFSGNWTIPASLAAVLVIVVGVVHLLEQQPGYETFDGVSALPELPEPATLALTEKNLPAQQEPESPPQQGTVQEQLVREKLQVRKEEEKLRKRVTETEYPAKPAPAMRSAPRPKAVTGVANAPGVTPKEAPVETTVTSDFSFRSSFSSPAREQHPGITYLDAIRRKRLAGEQAEANRLMDEFIAVFIEDGQDKVLPGKKLSEFGAEARARLLDELEALGRKKQASAYRLIFDENPVQ